MTTLRDIAKECGVSHVTVSHVLNKTAIVKAETRERVLATIDRLNYQPSAMARGLAGKKTNLLGVGFPMPGMHTLTGTYAGAIMDGIFTAANRRRQDVAVFSGRDWEDERLNKALYHGGYCDGLIMVAPRVNCRMISSLREAGFPFVIVNDFVADSDITCLDIDNFAAAHLATSHLIEQGHRRITAIHFGPRVGCNRPRMEGYRAALTEHGLVLDSAPTLEGAMPSWDQGGFASDMARLFRLPSTERPTAVFCFSDTLAVHVISLLQEMGLQVPEDVSVIGINDEMIGRICSPALTTIGQPMQAISERATDLLLDQIHQSAVPGQKELFPHALVVRESVRPPAS